MNIAQIGSVDGKTGGVSIYINYLINKKINNQVNYYKLIENSGTNKGQEIYFRIRYNFFSVINRIVDLFYIVKKYDINIFHAHTQRASFLIFLLSFFLKFKFIYTPHGFRHSQLSGLKKTIHLFIEKLILSRVNVLILLSSKEKKILVNFYKNKINFKIIDTYVDVKFKKKKISLLENKIKDHIVIGNVANIYRIKQPELFFSIAKKFLNINKKIIFIWIGNSLEEKYTNYFKKNKLDNIIHFSNVERNQVLNILSKIDYFILTSFFETFPLALLEALSLGKTCIVNNYNGVDEIIKNKINGYLFDFNDKNSAFNIINYLVKKKIKIKKSFLISETKKYRNYITFISKHEHIYLN
jgi:glycosyltransferase involved in cell wall biosynthesis